MKRLIAPGVITCLLALVVLATPRVLDAANPPVGPGQYRTVCTVQERNGPTALSCPVLVIGRPASVTIMPYSSRTSPRPLTTITLHDHTKVDALLDLLDSLNYPPLGTKIGCTYDGLDAKYDRLQFRYPNGDRWTIRVQQGGCFLVMSHGVIATDGLGLPRYLQQLGGVTGTAAGC